MNIKDQKIEMVKSRDKIINDKTKKDLYNLRTNKSWQAAAYSITGTGNYGDTDFLNGYLAVAMDTYKAQLTPDEITRLASTVVVKHINPEIYAKIKSQPNGAKNFFEDLILKTNSPSDKQMIIKWRDSYFQLKNIK